jgi:hypothetical protein
MTKLFGFVTGLGGGIGFPRVSNELFGLVSRLGTSGSFSADVDMEAGGLLGGAGGLGFSSSLLSWAIRTGAVVAFWGAENIFCFSRKDCLVLLSVSS